MRLTTKAFLEHRSSCQDSGAANSGGAKILLAPGASSSCVGSSSCSCGAMQTPFFAKKGDNR